VRGVPCNRIAVSRVSRDPHDPAIRNALVEKHTGLTPVTPRLDDASVVRVRPFATRAKRKA